MHPMHYGEIARSRQAHMLEEARLARLALEAKAASPQPSRLEKLYGRFLQRRTRRPAVGLAVDPQD